ncbi:gag-pol polyprotein [Cucumis melo var. makuwa]|uniref:Gag-pol polyprotein n=1 Tax=Cucumis melo var. makuwa TaxID=1194695 RepID=A0A5D3BLP1_CUCMM|nr:gag-pol polyprotein [Cucumis melo var. makuwa]
MSDLGSRTPTRIFSNTTADTFIVLSSGIRARLSTSNEFCAEGTSTSRPTILDVANYTYWKVKMISFQKSIDKEDEESLRNSQALNALYNGVDQNVFKLINTCTSVKKAWDILEVADEGTSKVKISRLQVLSSKFKALKIVEDEIVTEFNVLCVMDLANESFALREKLFNTKLVKKVLRTLTSRFNIKVTAIEEANDITTMKLDELFGSLRTFELSFDDNATKKKSGIAFQGETIVDEPCRTFHVFSIEAQLQVCSSSPHRIVRLRSQVAHLSCRPSIKSFLVASSFTTSSAQQPSTSLIGHRSLVSQMHEPSGATNPSLAFANPNPRRAPVESKPRRAFPVCAATSNREPRAALSV